MMRKFLIGFLILISTIFFTLNVSAKSYKDETTTYDYNFLKEKVIEKYSVNLDDYEYFSMRTIAYDANWPDVTPQIQFIAWNNAEININYKGDIGLNVTLSNTNDFFSGVYIIKNSLLQKNNNSSFEITFNDFDTETYNVIKSDVKGFDSITYNDTVYTFDRIDKTEVQTRDYTFITLTDFFIIKKDDYTLILSNLDLLVDESSSEFYLGYALSNIFAYIIIYFFIKSALTVYYMFFKKKRGVL